MTVTSRSSERYIAWKEKFGRYTDYVKEVVNAMSTIARIPCGIVNCYLLRGDTGSILIDTGNPNDADRITVALNGTAINLILLTHGHTDHCGAAAELRERLKAPIAMSEADVELIANPNARKLYGHTLLGRVLAKASATTMENGKVKPFKPDVTVDDGFVLTPYGVTARVIALPGHTKGSVGVLTEQGDMLVGDAAFHMLRPTSARIYEDREQMEESMEKIKSICKGSIYVGHGKAIKPTDIHE